MKDLHGGNIYKFQREGKNDILDYSSKYQPTRCTSKIYKYSKREF